MGSNAVIRESAGIRDTFSLYQHLQVLSRTEETNPASLDFLYETDLQTNEKKQVLVSRSLKSIIYDQSHYNEPILSQISIPQSLSLIALNSFSHIIQGTTRGYDDLFPQKVKIVKERRLYLPKPEIKCEEIQYSEIEVGFIVKYSCQFYEGFVMGSWDNWQKGIPLQHIGSDEYNSIFSIVALNDLEYLKGLECLALEEDNIYKYAEVRLTDDKKKSVLHFYNAPQSLCVILKCSLREEQQQAIKQLNTLYENMCENQTCVQNLKSLKAQDINFLLYSIEQEEKMVTGESLYQIPGQGSLFFAGFGGILPQGSFLIPKLYDDAKALILTFAQTIKHGLIANQLDSIENLRYNSRDACWWFIKAISDYILFTKDYSILKEKVYILFLSDDILEDRKFKQQKQQKILPLQDIIHQIFQKHAKGIKFREWRAGFELDSALLTEGFNIELKLCETTGFIIGGNNKNALTWMNKIGSSQKAGNKGFPACCRDGAPIECTALLKRALKFAINCKYYPYTEVETHSGRKLSFKQWSQLIKANFEKHYWIPINPNLNADDSSQCTKFITKRSIYKDTCFSKIPRQEYLLRPNGCISICLAPELFVKQNALLYLANVEAYLMGKNSIGLQTLDKDAPEYVPDFDLDDNSNQPKTSQGFSQHNGPVFFFFISKIVIKNQKQEYVWLFGYFLKSLIKLYKKQYIKNEKIMSYLAYHKEMLKQSSILSLPEVTKQNGEFCASSCQSYSQSIALLIEISYDCITVKK
ncbi:hypothetical protein IMG5_121490 [Ichthyophthirius multifiliis]|uniref:Glycogen debranching enzyme C-terminal domain-containing protein n=1 Tax=Ichthyophthirius multifiliis TaxID=5932 RepID=G0QV62_ICHMU|nr:hypothetical protein IMG5_121490 [Ichthyophthirius multifiliis]EGR30903.1 hypothetical protein IMG5_121490 [Ichthyophthirius multifiliis]|eukprot:XP_004032490.1 hypothetical protein IMG5_121490 [Ichthyophthirius multifiliis]